MYSSSAATSAAGAGTFLAVLLAMGMFAILLAVVLYVLYVVANWKIFTKAGEAGWKSIIPIYNIYIQFKISWNTTMFWVMLALAVVGGIVYGAAPDNSIAVILYGVLILAACVIGLIDDYYLCKSFGKGTGFFVGMIITSFFGLSWIFNMILGFGSARYIGNGSEQR